MKVMYERVAGIDVHKDMIKVAVRSPGEKPWTRKTEILEYRTFYGVLQQTAADLRRRGVTHVVMEASGVIRGRQQASATGGDGPLCSFLLLSRTVAWGPSATQTADRGADPATTSRRCRFCPFLADASATARPGPCPISSHLRPG